MNRTKSLVSKTTMKARHQNSSKQPTPQKI